MVTVSNLGNPADSNGYGSVDYWYRIGKYEVTNDEWCEFLNAVDPEGLNYYSLWGGLTPPEIIRHASGPTGEWYAPDTGKGDKPVYHVNFWDAARFANWLHLGQPSTTPGAGYPIDIQYGAYDGPLNFPYTGSNNVPREDDWKYAVASHNEWYKAAYYDPTRPLRLGRYWNYPTQSNSAPKAEGGPGGSNSANYDDAVGDTTEVGTYLNSGSYYGTFDQGGNVEEWTDTIRGDDRVTRGGDYRSDATMLHADTSTELPPSWDGLVGFRVVSSVSPIPIDQLVPAPIQDYLSYFAQMPNEPLQIVNDTGVPWRGLRVILARKEQSQDDPHIRFADLGNDDVIYTGPGIASFFDRDGDPNGYTEVMRLDDLYIPEGDTLRFLVDIQGQLGQEGLLEFDIIGEPIASALIGDLNFDGVVDIFDVNLVSVHWGEAGPIGDANEDGIVDIFDVNLISANWTTGGAAAPEAPTHILAAGGLGVPAVPEPASVGLLLTGFGLVVLVRRRNALRAR